MDLDAAEQRPQRRDAGVGRGAVEDVLQRLFPITVPGSVAPNSPAPPAPVSGDVVGSWARSPGIAGPTGTGSASLEEQVHGLSQALHSRDVIGQAKGVLIAHLGIGPDAAFALLVRCSQHANTKLAALAAVLVDRVCEPGPADPSHRPSQHTVIDELLTESRRRC